MQEDRQREIAAENDSLMHRLAGIMREERASPVRKFAHLSMEYRESLRRKKLLKLEVRMYEGVVNLCLREWGMDGRCYHAPAVQRCG